MKPQIVAGIFAALNVSGCATTNTRAPLPFLERFYVAKVPFDSSLMYEADATTHVLLIDQLPRAYDHISQNSLDSGTSHAWRVILSPMFVIRQLNDSSAAVRTPSFMPRLSVEWLRVSRTGRVSPPEPVIGFASVNVTGIRLSLAHHSNGQAGCFRAGFVPVDRRSETCVPAAGTDTNVVVLNRANGDFSSTYFEVMAHSTRMTRLVARIPTLSGGVALAGDWFAPFLFGALSHDQRFLYGSWRARGLVDGMLYLGIACVDPGQHSPLCLAAGRARLNAEYVRAPNLSNDLARRVNPSIVPYRWSVELSDSFDRLLGAGPFVRYIDGQDYYNIGFVHRRRGVMWGVMLDMSGPDRIRKADKRP